MFKVIVQGYDDLSAEEKQEQPSNGYGKEMAGYIRVLHNGKTIRLESDAIEPEDKTFYRELGWIVDAIKDAYKLGEQEKQP